MVVRNDVEKAIASGQIATLVYKGSKRVINPVEIIEGRNGREVLVAQEDKKGWRRYTIDEISDLELLP